MKKTKRNIRRSKNKSKKQVYKTNKSSQKNTKIYVKINLKKGEIETFNNNFDVCYTKFRGFSDNGSFYKLYNKNEIHAIQKEILVKYQEKNGRIPLKKRAAMRELIAKNIDTSVYKALKNYDMNNFWETSKHLDYINAMLKNVPQRKYETDKSYKKRVVRERNKLLDAAGINIEYDLHGMLLNRNNLFDNFKILKNAFRMKSFSSVSIFKNNKQIKQLAPKNQDFHCDSIKSNEDTKKHRNIQELVDDKEDDFCYESLYEKEDITDRVVLKSNSNSKNMDFEPLTSKNSDDKNNLKQSIKIDGDMDFEPIRGYKNVKKPSDSIEGTIDFEAIRDQRRKSKVKTTSKKYTSKKGLIYDLRKKAMNPEYIRSIGKKATVAAILGLIVLTFSSPVGSYSKAAPLQNSANKTKEFETNADIDGEQTMKNVLSQNPILSNHVENIVFEEETDAITVNLDQSDVQDENLSEETIAVSEDNIEKDEEIVNMNDALIETLGLGINSECSIADGKYYSSPNKQGKFGNYSKIKTAVRINYIDAIESDGTYYKYDLTDGKTISDIKKEHPNAKISYHMVTSGGMTLGWNDASDNDIETQLVKNALMNIKSYLSEETMQFLCDNELSSSIDKSQYSEHFEQIRNAMTQYQQDLQNSNADMER